MVIDTAVGRGRDRHEHERGTISPAAAIAPPQPLEPSNLIHLIEKASSTDSDLGCFLHVTDDRGRAEGSCAVGWRDVDLAARAVTKTHGSRRIALDDEPRQRWRHSGSGWPPY
jgi:hypothetical protein